MVESHPLLVEGRDLGIRRRVDRKIVVNCDNCEKNSRKKEPETRRFRETKR